MNNGTTERMILEVLEKTLESNPQQVRASTFGVDHYVAVKTTSNILINSYM